MTWEIRITHKAANGNLIAVERQISKEMFDQIGHDIVIEMLQKAYHELLEEIQDKKI
jgi:hypothetical protein